MISIGYTATDIIDGTPYGTQLELGFASGSPRLFAAASAARRASYAFAYSGLSATGVAGGGASFGSAPRPALYGPHAPLKSGAGFVCARARPAKDTTSPTTMIESHNEMRSRWIIGWTLLWKAGPGPCRDRCRVHDRQ